MCEIRDKMQVVYKELTCDMGELCGKLGLDNAGGISDEMK